MAPILCREREAVHHTTSAGSELRWVDQALSQKRVRKFFLKEIK
jgi:hypothetical protein